MPMAQRVYQAWKGNNRFFLGGRLVFGPDIRSLFITVVLIVAPIAIFCVFVVRNLLHKFSQYNSGYAILVVTIVYTFYVLLLLLLTSARDPGIVPRALHPPEPDEFFESESFAEHSTGQTPRLSFPRTKDLMINGVLVKVKYCETCMVYRPPRCSHCSICDNCVERFDHHCPWVGQCIGQRNYLFFFMFVASTTLLCIYAFAISALYIKFLMDGGARSVWEAMRRSPASVILMIYTFISVWFVGGLTIFHLYLISSNQTTYENFRYRSENRINPYDQGASNNFREVFCTGIRPSKNNFRARVEQDVPRQTVYVPPNTESQDDAGNLRVKIGSDVEAGESSTGVHGLEGENNEELQSQHSNSHDVGLDVKDGYEDAFARAIGRPISSENIDARTGAYSRRSSWGRRNENFEISPEILSLGSGITESARFSGHITPPGNS
ncbi:hypothetical protein SUGI_0481280 [Cryptomeria japonica]|nr:hypothetical protein SUGI_0481280 [Cryptomeria japonica]